MLERSLVAWWEMRCATGAEGEGVRAAYFAMVSLNGTFSSVLATYLGKSSTHLSMFCILLQVVSKCIFTLISQWVCIFPHGYIKKFLAN